MSDSPSADSTRESDAEEHTHHWLIGDQEGPSSPAVCKECGEQREFSNSFTRKKSMWTPRSGAVSRPNPGSPEGDEND
jgi:hypothetical protein